MELKLKAKPEDIVDTEIKKTIKIYWKDILNGEDINPTIGEWLDIIEDLYVIIDSHEETWSSSEETRIYEFVKGIAQICKARMTSKLEEIAARLSDIKREYTE